jgi:hypothetical protein
MFSQICRSRWELSVRDIGLKMRVMHRETGYEQANALERLKVP